MNLQEIHNLLDVLRKEPETNAELIKFYEKQCRVLILSLEAQFIKLIREQQVSKQG